MRRWRSPRYRRRSIKPLRFPRFPKKVIIIAIAIVLFLFVFSIIDQNLTPAIMSIAEAKAHHVANEAINKALYDKVLANVNYNDLIIVHKDSQQRVTMMQANSVRIGRIVSQANLEIKQSLAAMEEEILRVPLGQALGSRILANYGPRINVRIIPYGTVDVKFSDEFQQAGINQVRHILYLDIDTTVKIVIPTVSGSAKLNNKIPIAEAVIVGDVPDTFVGLGSEITKNIIDMQQKE